MHKESVTIGYCKVNHNWDFYATVEWEGDDGYLHHVTYYEEDRIKGMISEHICSEGAIRVTSDDIVLVCVDTLEESPQRNFAGAVAVKNGKIVSRIAVRLLELIVLDNAKQL
jgi:hypothetical protein